MKKNFDKPVNVDRLREEFAAEFGSVGRVGTSSFEVPDHLVERALELFEAHSVYDLTEKQEAWLTWEANVQGVRQHLGLVADATFEKFIALMQDSEKVQELVWLLWLLANPPAP